MKHVRVYVIFVTNRARADYITVEAMKSKGIFLFI